MKEVFYFDLDLVVQDMNIINVNKLKYDFAICVILWKIQKILEII